MAKVPLDVVWLEWQSNGGGANSAWTDAYLCRVLEAIGVFANEGVWMGENHFAGRPQLAHDLGRAWMTELKELIGMAANDDRREPLLEYVTRGRSWKFMTVLEHALRRGSPGSEGGGAGGVFSNEIVDMLIGLYQVLGTTTNVGNATRCESPIIAANRRRPLRFSEVGDLWLQVKSMFKAPKKATTKTAAAGGGKARGRRRRRRLESRKSASSATGGARGFPDCRRTSSTSALLPSNLAAFEETNSSDGTELGTVARENATENGAAFVPPCPMDFKYFDSVVRSDEEAKYMAKWRKTDKKRGTEDTNAADKDPTAEAKEWTPPSPAHLSDRHEEIMAVTLTNDDVRCQVLSLLMALCSAQARRRHLGMSGALALCSKMIDFCATQMAAGEDSAASATSVGDVSGKSTYSAPLFIRKLLANLILLALTQVQFPLDYRTLLAEKALFRLGLGVLQASLNRCDNAEEAADAIHIAAALLNTVLSIDSLPGEITGSSGRSGGDIIEAATDDDAVPLALEVFLCEGGAEVVEKCLAMAAKYRNNSALHADIALLYQETGRVLTAQRLCEHSNSSASRKVAKDTSKLFQALVKNVTWAVKKCAAPRGGGDAVGGGMVPEVATLDFMESLVQCLSAGSKASSACMNIVSATEMVLDAVRIMAATRKTAGVVRHLLCALERITQHEAEYHKAPLTSNASQDRTKVMSSGAATAKRPASIASDSDSAFYASDGSLEAKTSKQQQPRTETSSTSCHRFFELKHYLEVITQAESRSIAGAVLEHLGRLLHVCPQYRTMVFLKIVVPFLDDKSMISSSSSVDDLSTLSDVDVCAVGHCLGLVCSLLEHPDMLEHCHRQKVLQMVVSFRSTSELIEMVYDVLRKYLECAVDECCRMRTTIPKPKLTHCVSKIKSEEMVQMELQAALTDEEVFQPEIQRALLFGSIAKDFHDIVLSRTVHVLDVKAGDARFVALKELCCVWQIQSHLVEAFSEYQDYAKARGITRLVESLLDKLLEMLLSPASSSKSGIVTAEAVGHLISILVEFVAARELNESALSGPSEYFDEAKILDDSLRKISESLLRLDSPDVLRKVVSCIISAACSRQPFEGRTRSTMSASGSTDDLRSIASSMPSSSLSSSSKYSCDADASDSFEGETTAVCASYCRNIKSAKIFLTLTKMVVEMLRSDLPLAVPTASYLFHNLQRLESGNEANRNILAENGTTSLILNNFQELTKDGGPCHEVVRLLVSLGTQLLHRFDFRLFMEKFKDENKNQRQQTLLLKTISDIASNSYDAVVLLKIPGSGGKQDSVGDDLLVDGASVRTSTPEKSGPVSIDMVNAWSRSPLHFDLSSTCTNRFLSLDNEFSIAFWIKLPSGENKSRAGNPLRHLVSIGNKSGLFEVWFQGANSMIVRVSSANEVNSVMSRATFSIGNSAALKDGWNLVLVTCKVRSSNLLSVGGSINCHQFPKLAISPKNFAPGGGQTDCGQRMLIGSSVSEHDNLAPCFGLSSVIVCDGDISEHNVPVGMMLLGPEDTTFARSDISELLGSRDILRRWPDAAAPVIQSLNLERIVVELRSALRIGFSARGPTSVLVYPKPAKSSGGLFSAIYSQTQQHQSEQAASFLVPIMVQAEVSSNISVAEGTSFAGVVMAEGGVHTLLLLLARIVELDSPDVAVSLAINTLLATVQSSPEARSDFIQAGGLGLMSRILDDAKCNLGLASLKVLFDHACTEPVLVFDEKSGGGVYRIDCRARSLIHDAVLFELALKRWGSLDAALDPANRASLKSSSCLQVALRVVLSLVANDATGLNRKVVKACHLHRMLIHKLIEEYTFCNEEGRCFYRETKTVLAVWGNLVGAPPDVSVMRTAMALCLLLHDTGQTFVAHYKSSFYYSLTAASASSTRSGSSSSVKLSAPNNCRGHDEEDVDDDDSDEGGGDCEGDGIQFSPESLQRALMSIQKKRRHDKSFASQSNTSSNGTSTNAKRASGSTDGAAEKALFSPVGGIMEDDTTEKENSTDGGSSLDEADMSFLKAGEHSVLEHPGQWGEDAAQSDEGDGGGPADQNSVRPREHLQTLDLLLEGLLDCLVGAVINVPDVMMREVLADVIRPEHLLVLCNHPHAGIRERVVALTWQLIRRSSSASAGGGGGFGLQKLNGYLLLANQLHRHPTTEAVVNACLSIAYSREFRLENGIEITSDSDVSLRISGLVLLLSLMPNSVADVAVAHGLVLHVHELCSKIPGVLQNYSHLGLFEAICKTLASLAETDGFYTDVCGQDSRDIVFADLHNMLRLVAFSFVTAHGSDAFRATETLLKMLAFLSLHYRGEGNATSSLVFQDAAATVLDECLSDIKSRAAQMDASSAPPRSGAAGKQGGYNIYNGLFPIEEMTDLLMRTVSPRESVVSGPTSTMGGASDNSYMTPGGGDKTKPATRNELSERFSALVDFAIDFVAFHVSFAATETTEIALSELTDKLTDSLLPLLISELLRMWEDPKAKIMFPGAQRLKTARTKMLDLVVVCLQPQFSSGGRLKVLRLIDAGFRTTQMMYFLFENCASHATAVAALTRRILEEAGVSEEDSEGCQRFLQVLNSSVAATNATGNQIGTTDEPETAKLFAKARERMDRCTRDTEHFFSRFDDLTRETGAHATQVTKTAVAAQDEERKAFMGSIRDCLAGKVRSGQEWHDVIGRHTHQGSIWHFADRSPRSWFLSEGEGTQRVRIRTESRFTGIEMRHYLPEFRSKSGVAPESPFSYLTRGPTGMSGVIIEQLNSDDHIRYMQRATLVQPEDEVSGELLFSAAAVYFVGNSDYENEGVAGSSSETGSPGSVRSSSEAGKPLVSLSWKMSALREVHRRWYQLNDTAVELFFEDGTTRLFSFGDRKRRNGFLRKLNDSLPPSLVRLPSPEQVLRLWQDGAITNFDYLMQLNKLAGRTFNDLMQYPIFPFVLSDYTSQSLDLHAEKTFRNLRKPIAIQNECKRERYLANYNALVDELERNVKDDDHELDEDPGLGPYHYGSHYSNTGVVLHFLVRLPPFTAMFLRYQDGNFDLPDRSFHSLENTWRLASSESTTDVKELIPDLFSTPEVLLNQEGFDFGRRQNGDWVSDVKLPPWALDNPRLFVKIHRQSLESDVVRESLSHWIDLVFGYKQKGREARDAVNLFHPATYYGFDLSTIRDPLLREARATMIKTYGQTPRQLFTRPHPMINKNWTKGRAREGPPHAPRAVDNVVGLRWGRYVGSPSMQEPKVVWRGRGAAMVAAFAALDNHEVFGLPGKAGLVVRYSQDVGSSTVSPKAVCGAGVVTFGHPDGVLRFKLRKSATPQLFKSLAPSAHKVSVVAVGAEGEHVWLGFDSGKISALSHSFDPKVLTIKCGEETAMYGHSDRVTCLDVCDPFGVAASGSADGTLVLWDSKKLLFVRRLQFGGEVTSCSVSKTSGDVAVVSRIPGGAEATSLLSTRTINGMVIGERRCEPPITAAGFSSCPEGVSVNVVATGHRNGMVRLWSSWDLSPVRDIPTLQTSAVTAVAFSFDNQNLYAATEDGEVVIFEKSNVSGLDNAPKFVDLTSLTLRG